MNLPHEPFFVRPPVGDNGGVDFLGLRQVNLALMDEFLPGINNVTWNLRPYSMMCWAVWAFQQEAVSKGVAEIKQSEFVAFREKVEVLFGWTHQLAEQGGGMVGNAQVRPAINGDVPLDFASWKRNVSWFDAVNYGPSLKDENGLGFVRQVAPKIYASTDSGALLAEAIDAKLRRMEGYNQLRSRDAHSLSEELAAAIYPAWAIDNPSPKEAEVFRQVLYYPDSIGTGSRTGHRSASIALILAKLNEFRAPVTVAELRRHLACGSLPRFDTLFPEKNIRDAHAIWKVLQVRQAQRLAFETLFGWLEDRIFTHRDSTSVELVQCLMNALEASGRIVKDAGWIRDTLLVIEQEGQGADSILAAGLSNAKLDVFAHMEQLQAVVRKSRDASAVLAIALLLLTAAIAKQLSQDAHCAPYVAEGDARRVSLKYWADFVHQKQALPAESFLTAVIENLMLSQHFGVAAVRTSENKPRLRLTIEEQGLESLLKRTRDIWSPAPTPDRLAALLSLMADCGLVDGKWSDEQEEWRYTTK